MSNAIAIVFLVMLVSRLAGCFKIWIEIDYEPDGLPNQLPERLLNTDLLAALIDCQNPVQGMPLR